MPSPDAHNSHASTHSDVPRPHDDVWPGGAQAVRIVLFHSVCAGGALCVLLGVVLCAGTATSEVKRIDDGLVR